MTVTRKQHFCTSKFNRGFQKIVELPTLRFFCLLAGRCVPRWVNTYRSFTTDAFYRNDALLYESRCRENKETKPKCEARSNDEQIDFIGGIERLNWTPSTSLPKRNELPNFGRRYLGRTEPDIHAIYFKSICTIIGAFSFRA